MTANPADDPVLRVLEEAGLEGDATLSALLGELRATAAEEPPAPSRDVVRLMSGRRPARSSWFARRGARTTTVVLLAAALAGGASAAAASPAFHTVVGDAFSSLAKLVGPPTRPEPAAPALGHDTADVATPSPQDAGGHQGPAAGSGDAEASQASPSSAATDGSEQEPSASGARPVDGSHTAAGGVDASGDDPGRSAATGNGQSTGKGSGAGAGQGDDQGASGASSTQKRAPSRYQPAPTPPMPTTGSQPRQGGSSGSGDQGSDR